MRLVSRLGYGFVSLFFFVIKRVNRRAFSMHPRRALTGRVPSKVLQARSQLLSHVNV